MSTPGMERAAASGGAASSSATRRFVLRASLLSMVLVAAGAAFGLVRDLMMAGFFGASAATDAFLVAWTVPETAQPLLIEGAMALVLVPAVSRAAAQNGSALRDLIARTAPAIGLFLLAASAATAVAAPVLVRVLAPGLTDPELAIQCMRLISVSIALIGMTGYLSATLRALGVFGPPAAVYVAFNTGVIGLIILGHDELGVLSAALGVTVGSAAMAVLLLASAWGRVSRPSFRPVAPDLAVLSAFLPVGAYTLGRQGQVYIERFLGSGLPEGTVSHLNYAQKIGQIPASLSLLVATVTFPLLARTIARGGNAAARGRLIADLRIIVSLVVFAAIVLAIYAPEVVDVLLQRGEFGSEDTVATAAILRVYVLGLAGQAVTDILCRAFFSRSSPSWYPAAAMAGGLVVTAGGGTLLVAPLGAAGISAANAAGITTTALLLVARSDLRAPAAARRARALVSSWSVIVAPLCAAAVAALAARQLPVSAPLAVVVIGATTAAAAFVLTLAVVGRRGGSAAVDPAVEDAPPEGRRDD